MWRLDQGEMKIGIFRVSLKQGTRKYVGGKIQNIIYFVLNFSTEDKKKSGISKSFLFILYFNYQGKILPKKNNQLGTYFTCFFAVFLIPILFAILLSCPSRTTPKSTFVYARSFSCNFIGICKQIISTITK